MICLIQLDFLVDLLRNNLIVAEIEDSPVFNFPIVSGTLEILLLLRLRDFRLGKSPISSGMSDFDQNFILELILYLDFLVPL